MNEINFVINLTTWRTAATPLTPALSLREKVNRTDRPLSLRERVREGKMK
jgi:hypothetical protein